MTKAETGDVLTTVDRSVQILEAVMTPDGYNVGLNLGKVAGAGIEAHLHFHIVPKWMGDTNATTVLADARVVSEHIQTNFSNLKPHFARLTRSE